MGHLLPLSIFPQGSLASSVITTVWVGVFVITFFNLRLGWALSGLIIPGYLVPLILVKPWSASVIILEGITCYGCVWFYSEFLSRWCGWNNFFGRDRFFALILCSIVIRITFDGWLLPWVGERLVQRLQVPFDYHNNLHSFGLIMVALIANQLWKTGLLRGTLPFATTLLITWVIVRYGLMEFTNFSISTLSYLYEDMAASILASPKAYIILVSAAFMASRMNLYYGWDYNGILIPSLLALQWYQPLKILATFVEAGIILLIANGLLATSIFKNITIEGARKLLLFFNISFAYKLTLGYAILYWLPAVKVTDSYGFGYLVATLIALKIHDKAILARLTRAIVQTSLMAILYASLTGFILTFLFKSEAQQMIAPDQEQPASILTHSSLNNLLASDRIKLHESRLQQTFDTPSDVDIQYFTQAMEAIHHYQISQKPLSLQPAAVHLARINYQIFQVEDHYLYLSEKAPRRGWGTYVLNLHTSNTLTVEIPAPLDERGAMDAGITLFHALQAQALAIAGTSQSLQADHAADVLTNRQTLFHHFHRIMGQHNALQVRTYTGQLPTVLQISQRLPKGLNLVQLKSLMGDYQIQWNSATETNKQRQFSRHGFAELTLNTHDVRSLALQAARPLSPINTDQTISGYLYDHLLRNKEGIANKGSNHYTPAQLDELLFFDTEILTPLFQLLNRSQAMAAWTPSELEELQQISALAKLFDYQINLYHHRSTKQDYLLLTEINTGSQRRYWGTYILRLGNYQHYLVEVPRPRFEAKSLEFGISLFETLQARALLIAGAHPMSRTDGRSDLLNSDNKASLFNLFSQVFLREQGDTPTLLIQSRVFAIQPSRPTPEGDVLFALSQGSQEHADIRQLETRLRSTLQQKGLTITSVEGTAATAGYEASSDIHTFYLDATRNKGFVRLWLSPLARQIYRQPSENYWQTAQFQALGIPSDEGNLYQLAGADEQWSQTGMIPQGLIETLRRYQKNQDILLLAQLKSHSAALTFRRLIDINNQQTFLLVYDPSGKLVMLTNLSPPGGEQTTITQANTLTEQLSQLLRGQLSSLQWKH